MRKLAIINSKDDWVIEAWAEMWKRNNIKLERVKKECENNPHLNILEWYQEVDIAIKSRINSILNKYLIH